MSLRLKPYPAYKPSALSSLGVIPEHWAEVRAKYLFREIDERSVSGNEELLSVSHITGVTPRSQKNVTMFMAESNVGHKRCQPDDLVINTMWAWMGALGISRFAGIVSPSYGVYRPTSERTLSSFLDALLRTTAYIDEYVRRSTGINSSRLRLYPERFLTIPLLIPTMEEQGKITRFVRFALSSTDRLIRAKRGVIALMNEQKRAVVHRAVTRGIDAPIALKPTGWEWVGSVPHHWNAPTKLKYISFLKGRLGWQGLKASEYTDTGPYVVSSAHFRNQRIDWKICPHVTKERYDIDENIQLRENDILLMKDGAAMGKLAIIDHLPNNACLNSHLLLFRPLTDAGVSTYDPKFLFYFMLTRSFQDFIQVNGTGTTFLGVSQESIGNYKVCLPPIQEQRQIATILDLETSQYDNAIASIETQIQLLRDYRTRLIADVVTGKLDVRGVKLPELEAEELTEPLGEEEGEETEESEELVANVEGVDAE